MFAQSYIYRICQKSFKNNSTKISQLLVVIYAATWTNFEPKKYWPTKNLSEKKILIFQEMLKP